MISDAWIERIAKFLVGQVGGIIPLAERKIDCLLIGFWLLNLGFISYIVDTEQFVSSDPSNFAYPLWSPVALVDLVDSWGNRFDPVLLANAPWLVMPIATIARMWSHTPFSRAFFGFAAS